MTFRDTLAEDSHDDVFQETPAARADLFTALDWCLALDVSHREFRVLIYFIRHAHPKGYCWPTQGRIVRDTGMSLIAVKRAIRVLAEAGHISIGKRGKWKKVNEYLITFYRDRLPPGKLAGF